MGGATTGKTFDYKHILHHIQGVDINKYYFLMIGINQVHLEIKEVK